MMLGLGLVLLFAPEALSHPLAALAVILVALVVTALVVWLAGPDCWPAAGRKSDRGVTP
jgi:hypothetical protein